MIKDLKNVLRGITGKKKRKKIIVLGKKKGNFGLMLMNYNLFEKIDFCLWLIKAGSAEIPYDEIDKEKLI